MASTFQQCLPREVRCSTVLGGLVPPEIEARILDYAGPLTVWLVHQYNTTKWICDRRYAVAIWRDWLRQKRRDVYPVVELASVRTQFLPAVRGNPTCEHYAYCDEVEDDDEDESEGSLKSDDYCELVTDREYYDFLRSLRRNAWSIPGNYYWVKGEDYVQLYHPDPLSQVAFRNVWTDEFSKDGFGNELWRLAVACRFGHADLAAMILNDEAQIGAMWKIITTELFPDDEQEEQDPPDVEEMLEDIFDTPFKCCSYGPTGHPTDGVSLHEIAALHGHTNVLKAIIARIPNIQIARCLEFAAWNGSETAVELLHRHSISTLNESCETDHDVFDTAGGFGNLSVVRWLHRNCSKGKVTLKALDGAAVNGHLEVCKYLHENQLVHPTDATIFYAVAGGHLEVIKWLHENFKSDGWEMAPSIAAVYGLSHVLKFLWIYTYDHRCGRKIVRSCVQSGHFEVIKFLHEHLGAVKDLWDDDLMDEAAKNDKIDVLQFLHENGHSVKDDNLVITCIEKRRLYSLKWLCANLSGNDRLWSQWKVPENASYSELYNAVAHYIKMKSPAPLP